MSPGRLGALWRRGKRALRRRRGWMRGAVVALLLAVSALFLALRGRRAQQQAAETAAALRSDIVRRGTLAVTVSATGKLEPEREAELPFLVSGRVAAVHVEPGDAVEKDELLASLDTRLLELSLRDAEIAQALQQIAVDQLKSGASEEELQVARAALWLAQAQLNQLTAPPDEYDIKIAELRVELARNQLYERQTARDEAVESSATPGERAYVGDRGLESALGAELGIDIAQLQKEQLLQGPSAGQVASARAQVVAAQARLDKLLEGPDPYDLAIAEKQVKLAGLSVQLARETLEDAEIRAPFAGTVAEVNLSVGQQAQPGVPVIRLIDENEYRLELDIDEVDIARVQVEQPVRVTFDGVPGKVFIGHIERIAPVATDVGGVTTYRVRVALGPTSAPLRAGMTATAVITVDEVADALLVPNWAIRLDRRTGEAFVNVRNPEGAIEEVSVVIGLRGDTFSQVLSGLQAGDEVVVSQEREAFSLFGGEE